MRGELRGTLSQRGEDPEGQGRFISKPSLVAQTGKESACNTGGPGSIPRSGRSPGFNPWGAKNQTTNRGENDQYILEENDADVFLIAMLKY